MTPQTPRILLITDAGYADETIVFAIEAAARVLPPGAFAVQLRERGRQGRAEWGRVLRDVTRGVGAALIVNGDVRLARDLGAEGVHFGGGSPRSLLASGEGLWRSMAAHTDADVVDAKAAGLDAVLVSPIFDSPGKGAGRGVAALERAALLAEGTLAVLALGGVGLEHVGACVEAGASGVAGIRALLGAKDPGRVAAAMWSAM